MFFSSKNILNCKLSSIPINCTRNGLKSWTGGVKYPGLFTHFPKKGEAPDDPSFQPSKLLMVQRIKPFKGNHYKMKKILVDLGLDAKSSDVAIVKNTPIDCKRLYMIKHLVKITPIRTPNGVPSEADVSSGYLDKETGEFVVQRRVDPVRLDAATDFVTSPDRLDPETLNKDARLRWLNPYL